MKNLPEIINEAIDCGKGNTPAALIQHASLPHMKIVRGQVKELEVLAKEYAITHPALIVIGDVTNMETYSLEQTLSA